MCAEITAIALDVNNVSRKNLSLEGEEADPNLDSEFYIGLVIIEMSKSC